MEDHSALAEFKQGIQLLRDRSPVQASEHFHRAAELEKQNPYYLSFLGVSLARGQQDWVAAATLCETALNLKRRGAQLYLNLAEVYTCAGRREEAVAVLDKGSIYFIDDPRIRRARANLGRRRSSVLPFLERGHFLNRSLGKLRHCVMAGILRSADSNRISRLAASL
jgi:Flp pilus assembly protein TadD